MLRECWKPRHIRQKKILRALDINVRSGHGDISLPRAQTTPQPRGAFPYLNHDLFLSNSMRELNVALGQLQYRINTTKHYNTQVKKADGSAREP